MPHLLDLPTELLIRIFSDLGISDFGSCLLTCRRIKDVFQASRLQYLIRMALDGVHDPLLPSGPPFPHRLDSLRRWSLAWRHPSAYLRSPSRILDRAPQNTAEEFFLCDDYLMAMDFGGKIVYRHVAGYEWLDLRKQNDEWTKIRFEEKLVPLAFTLDPLTQQDLLAVLFGCIESATFQLRLIGFHDGLPHPLASRPVLDIALPTRATDYIGLRTCMSMMGPYLVVAAGLPPEGAGIDVLLLVDWQKGNITTLRTTLRRKYLTDFLVLSDDVLALMGAGNTIELCRISPTSGAPLQTIRLLELPPLLPHVRLAAATAKTENNNYSSAFDATRNEQQHRRHPPRHTFNPLPIDALVLLSLTTKIHGSVFIDTRTYTIAVHARTLLSYASTSPSTSTPSSSSSSPPHGSESSLALIPWDTWGPPATRCFDGHSGSSSAVLAAQRWLSPGTVRDFCPRRVRAAGAQSVKSRSVLAAGRFFQRDVESALPYSETCFTENEDALVVVDNALIDGEKVVFVSRPSRDISNIRVHVMG
ncbi:hypothetical protein BC827DRAFT_245214 [Russula dissimulans]|nr:hypothetical protein BC827DRAFT_245214 [Russula dissimulans]